MRETVSLNKGWEFALRRGFDRMEKGEEVSLAFSPCFIPHDWAVTSPYDGEMPEGGQQGYRNRYGTGWYRRTLDIVKKPGKVYRLCFDGIYEDSTVWVNDQEVGGRKYGYSPFSLDITDALRDGGNALLVRVDNTKIPVDRWYSGAGIYRKVYLEILPETHLDPLSVRTLATVENDGHGKIALSGLLPGKYEVSLVPGANEAPEACKTRDEGESKPFTGNEAPVLENPASFTTSSGNAELLCEAPDLWSAENPALYKLEIRYYGNQKNSVPPLDSITFRIGFRTVEFRPNEGLFINGKMTKLKGVCLHQDCGLFGNAVLPEIYRERLEAFKAIGVNYLRLAHHLYAPEVLDLADEMGFYVYEECFDKWTGGLYGRYYETEWKKDLSVMVERDRNRPSILFWGVGNEVENQAWPSMLAMLDHHIDRVNELDGTRPVSVAINPHFFYPDEKIDISEIKDIQAFVDEARKGEVDSVEERVALIGALTKRTNVICCNYQEQWYDRLHEAYPEKLILGTENYMYFEGSYDHYQNYSDKNPWFDVLNRDYVIGEAIWAGADYLGEAMCYPCQGWTGALFTADLEKKPIASLYESYWTEKPMLRFAVMDYTIPDTGVKEHWGYPPYETHWSFPMFTNILLPYMVATNCEEVELHTGGRIFDVPPVKTFKNRMVTGFVPYFAGGITIIGKIGGKEAVRQEIRTEESAAALRFDEKAPRLTINAGGTAGIRFKVRAYDENGTAVFREGRPVKFTVEGPAVLCGVENGDFRTLNPSTGDTVPLFHGRAAVGLVVTGAGTVGVRAEVEGLPAAEITVEAHVR